MSGTAHVTGERTEATTASPNAREVELKFQAAPEEAFRVRCVAEYRRIRDWMVPQFDWNAASILDFGCGDGYAAASIALRHPDAHVFGADIVPVSGTRLAAKLHEQTGLSLPSNLAFLPIVEGELDGDRSFDLVYAWSTLEHVAPGALVPMLARLRARLRRNGHLFVFSDPLYYSPRGSLLYRYFSEPWEHLTASIDGLRAGVIGGTASETTSREWQQFVELNRFTAPDILDALRTAGFEVKRSQLFRTELEPTERLLRTHQRDALVTTGLQALLVPA